MLIGQVREEGDFGAEVHLALEDLVAVSHLHSVFAEPVSLRFGIVPVFELLQVDAKAIAICPILALGPEMAYDGHDTGNESLERHRECAL